MAVRLAYLARLFPPRRIGADVARAMLPTVPAVGVVLALRSAFGADAPADALVQAAAFMVVVAAVTAVWERRLLGDAVALLRGRPVGVLAVAAR